MNELLDQFAIEARELLEQASDDLLVLEREPGDRGRLESAFRAFHTLKGSVGLFDLAPMQAVLHESESLLEAARDGTIDIDSGLIDALVAVVDWVERCVEEIASSGTLPEALGAQSKQLLALVREDRAAESLPVGTDKAAPVWTRDLAAAGRNAEMASGPLVAIRYEPHPECFFNGDDPLALVARVPDLRQMRIAPRAPWPDRATFDPFRCNLRIEAISGAPRAEIERIFRLIPDQVRLFDLATDTPAPDDIPGRRDGRPEAAARATARVETVRVDTARIDALVSLAGELIAAKNALLPIAAGVQKVTGDDRLAQRIAAGHQEVDRLVGKLHAAVAKVRMTPLGHTFRRFPRLVRDTAARLAKPVDLVILGEGVEADREIVEQLFEPLLHLVRNALDHGIEDAATRNAAGKPPRGTLTLRASQRGDLITVEISDDGRGLDPDRIRAAAVARGLMTESEVAALSDAAALQLVFEAGFSTAGTVSDLSGRGVGLDVVQSAVEQMGGRVELTSTPGKGASFALHLPITVALLRLMVVEANGERYGLPLDRVQEVVRVPAREIRALRAGHAFVLRDRTVPFVQLANLIDPLLTPALPTEGDHRVLVVKLGGEPIGLAVDAIAERAETLMRPLTGLLKDLPGVAGTTTLGDGKVLLVLDLEDLVG